MKKSIIALAALAAMTAQADETTLYGSVRAEYTYQDGQTAGGRESGRSSSELGDAGSRFGIKGEESLGNGLSAFYKYENRLKDNAETNKLYAGIKSNTLGSVSLGKQNLPVDELENYSDPFNSLTPGQRGHVGYVDKNGKKVTLDNYAPKTSADKSAVYWTPNMNGFSAGVAGVSDGYNGEHNHVDYVSATAKYEANGFFAGVGYSQHNDDKENDAYTVGLGYGNDKFEVGVLADYYKLDNADDITWARVSALYNVTPMDSVYAGYSSTFGFDGGDIAQSIKDNAKSIDDDWSAAVGYQHKFSKRSRMWAEYGFQDQSDINKVSVGLRTDF